MISQKLNPFDDDIKYLDQIITKATVDLYKTIEKRYLPTPTKIHYVKFFSFFLNNHFNYFLDI
jgi:hypothetical protein